MLVTGSTNSYDYSDLLYEGQPGPEFERVFDPEGPLPGELPVSVAAGTDPVISGDQRNPFRLLKPPLLRTPRSDFFEDNPPDCYLKARMVKLGGAPITPPFESLDDLAPFVPPPRPPSPQKPMWERIRRAMGCIPLPIIRVGDEMTIIREGLSPRAQKLFDDLPRFHRDFEILAIRELFARTIDRLLSERPLDVEVTKRDRHNDFSKTVTQLPNGAVTVKLDWLAHGGNKKVYEVLYILPNAQIKNVIEQRYLRNVGVTDPPQFSLVQEALIAHLFDSPYVVKGPMAYFNRENGNQSVIMKRYDFDFSKGLSRVNIRNALTILEHVSLGLAHIHSRGCVHRDIKPQNIFLETFPDGSHRGVVGDLGLLVSELSCTELRRNILQPIEGKFMGRGLLGPLGEIKFTILSHYVDLSGGLYPLNIDMQLFKRVGRYPTLVNFQRFVNEKVIDTIRRRYSQSSDSGNIGYQRGSPLIFSADGDPLFPLLHKYLKTYAQFPSNSLFVDFMKQKILEEVTQEFKSNRKIFNRKGEILCEPLRELMSNQRLSNFSSVQELVHFLQRIPLARVESFTSMRGYPETITFLKALDRVIKAFSSISERGDLPPQMAKFVDPIGFKATMEFLESLKNGLFEVRVWENGGPDKVRMPSGVPPFVPSTLTAELKLDLYPEALAFLNEVTKKFKVIDCAGTFIYMAPEQIHANIITSKTDIYALGVMLHDVLSEPYINSVLSSRRALDADLKALQREMTQIKYKERPTAEECAERIRSIIATHCG